MVISKWRSIALAMTIDNPPCNSHVLRTHLGMVNNRPAVVKLSLNPVEAVCLAWAVPRHVTFNAKAGKTYSVHWHEVKKEIGYLWIEDESGSVVSGEKPPAEFTAPSSSRIVGTYRAEIRAAATASSMRT